MTDFDALVVGAGVAGCAIALELVAKGGRVALLHRPQPELGFESISPDAVPELERLGVSVGAQFLEVIAWWGSDSRQCQLYPGARIVDRVALADALRKRAIERGVTVLGC